MAITKQMKQRYSQFIKGLELRNIHLVAMSTALDESQLSNNNEPWKILIDTRAKYTNIGSDLYRILQDWQVNVGRGEEINQLIKFKITFAVIVSSQEKITKRLFDIYAENNLTINTWPFTRELINNITARMAIPPLTLPFFKTLPQK